MDSSPHIRPGHDVFIDNGFLPPDLPLEALPNPYFEPWETIATNIVSLVSTRKLRGAIQSMPVLSTEELTSEAEWRRAYVLLVFIIQAYVWSESTPEEIIPPSISIPLLEIVAHFDLPPAATYTGFCLWNYKVLDPARSSEDPANLATLLTFTGTEDEEWFFLTSVAIEARGARMISQLLRILWAADQNDTKAATIQLQAFREDLRGVTTVLSRVRERCQPHVFYHHLRPFLNGTKNMSQEGLPRGVIFDDGTGFQEYRQYSGGSNAQSSLIQLFDIALGIEHEPSAGSFMEDMRQYMPGDHRRFLEDMTTVGNIRDYVAQNGQDEELEQMYGLALDALRELRDVHLHIVTQYIVAQSSTPLGDMDTSAVNRRTDVASSTMNQPGGKSQTNSSGVLRGTGGTPLIQFLKKVRDGVVGIGRR
ncbi:indoleamine 2,3-dioxygenase [Aspergillus melleus]|uniref:indoleamine 2,3-dioxygenase n=1 Tax=Aspergillus melleus TaxID=138277 RepID=UPI001E8CD814|nr:tryptophan 2,3- dioxygenase [Aspergillus melleus]KAH8427068.1 tryptophan 2,3- dioxygenase [Aspergillus melleus]